MHDEFHTDEELETALPHDNLLDDGDDDDLDEEEEDDLAGFKVEGEDEPEEAY